MGLEKGVFAPSASHASLPGLAIFHDLLVKITCNAGKPWPLGSLRTHAPAFSIADGLHCLHSGGTFWEVSSWERNARNLRTFSGLRGCREWRAQTILEDKRLVPLFQNISLAHSVRWVLKAVSSAACSLVIVLAKGHLSSMLITLLFL